MWNLPGPGIEPGSPALDSLQLRHQGRPTGSFFSETKSPTDSLCVCVIPLVLLQVGYVFTMQLYM